MNVHIISENLLSSVRNSATVMILFRKDSLKRQTNPTRNNVSSSLFLVVSCWSFYWSFVEVLVSVSVQLEHIGLGCLLALILKISEVLQVLGGNKKPSFGDVVQLVDVFMLWKLLQFISCFNPLDIQTPGEKVFGCQGNKIFDFRKLSHGTV